MAYQRIVSTGSVYKGKTGMWLYIFHRVTGVGLFGYLLLHIISTALIILGPEIYEGAEAIYKYFYNTDSPHTRPWEMFGHSEKPSDWEDTYGAAPYTSGNDVLWNAIATEPGKYGKPNIKNHIPVDASGNLLDPILEIYPAKTMKDLSLIHI